MSDLIDTSDMLIEQARTWLGHFSHATGAELEALQQSGGDLADRLRSTMIDLASSRAHEFSPHIPIHALLAAKIAIAAHGAGSPAAAVFEKDIDHYRQWPSTAVLVDEYARFRQALQAHG